jgi:hypothetical protein
VDGNKLFNHEDHEGHEGFIRAEKECFFFMAFRVKFILATVKALS